MALYFVQHGIAVAKEIDARRPLSPEGEQQVLAMARFLKSRGMAPTRIVHSGKLRASQTAMLLAEILGVTWVEIGQEMAPKDDANRFAARLAEDDSLYVGHLPHLQKVVSALVAGDPDAGIVRFRNAGVVCLESGGDHYEVAWYVVPQLC